MLAAHGSDEVLTAYLRCVFTHFADYPINRVADLLPWNVVDRLLKKSA